MNLKQIQFTFKLTQDGDIEKYIGWGISLEQSQSYWQNWCNTFNYIYLNVEELK